jgi:hypothetical protein
MSAPTTDILSRRLRNQKLTSADRPTSAALVAWPGAVQAQDYPAAKWALGLRARGLGDADIEQAFNDGAILRTHVLRPTWHLVSPDDIRWMLALSAPRVHAVNAYYYRQAGLDDRTVKRSCAMIQRSLDGGKHLTRVELSERLRRAKISADGLKLGRRTVKPNSVVIEVAPYKPLSKAHARSVTGEADCYGEFLNMPVELTIY